MDLLHPFFCPFTTADPFEKLGSMRKQLFIFIVAFTTILSAEAAPSQKKSKTKTGKQAKTAAAAPSPASLGKPLVLAPGGDWILTKDLTLQKTGLTPGVRSLHQRLGFEKESLCKIKLFIDG